MPLLESIIQLASVVAAAVSAKAALDAVKESRASGDDSRELNRIAEGQRQAWIRPHVIAYVRPGRTFGDFQTGYVHIHNVGLGAAIQVSCRVVKGEHHLPYGEGIAISEWGPFTKGITVMPPGDDVSTIYSEPTAGKRELPEVLIELSYQDIEGRKYEGQRFLLTENFLMNTVGPKKITSSSDPLPRIATSLEKISKKLVD